MGERSNTSSLHWSFRWLGVALLLLVGFVFLTTPARASIYPVLFDGFDDDPWEENWTLSTSSGSVYEIVQADSQLYMRTEKPPTSTCWSTWFTSQRTFSDDVIHFEALWKKEGYGASQLSFGDAATNSYVRFVLNTNDVPYVVIISSENGTWVKDWWVEPVGPYMNEWITLKIHKEGDVYTFYIDDHEVGTVTNDVIGDDDLYAKFGQQPCLWKTGAAVDRVEHVLIATEPQVISCVGFEPPMDGEAVTVKGKNRALPLKAQLFDAEGYGVTDVDIPSPPLLHIEHEYVDDDGQLVVEDVSSDAVAVGLATDGNEFVYLDDEAKWEYVLKTGNFSGEGMYILTMKAGSPDYVIQPTCEARFVR